MHPQPLARAVSVLSSEQESVRPVPTGSFREAHHQLCRQFAESQPLALLHSDSRSGSRYLIDQFHVGLANDVTIVRLTEPCRDQISCMSEIIRGIGFDPTDLSLSDLENVFTLFLSFQKSHACRTILYVEAAPGCGSWLLNVVRRIVAEEAEEQHGLLVVMSGPQSILTAVWAEARQSVYLAPFILAETREFLRWQVESTGAAKIAQVLEFDAITRIHEITGGEPDAVSSLLSKCLELASELDPAPVTVDLVDAANSDAGIPVLPVQELEEEKTMMVDQVVDQVSDRPASKGGRLVVRLDDGAEQEYFLDRGHVLIGRGKLCDVRIPRASVSRHHALIVNSPVGVVLVDLESTNGTFIDGERIREQLVESSGVITIGDCNIDFVGNDEQQDWVLDVHSNEQSEPYDDQFVTQQLNTRDSESAIGQSNELDVSAIKGNINSKGDKIYHIPGTAKYNATKIDESKGERWFANEDEAKAAGWRAPRK